jgi:deazaflavin-dependent oxidoreductase (nitroreductase family)
MLLLKHTGRKSGMPRQNVLEVIRRDSEKDRYFVASGFGERADWYQNIMKTPEVGLEIGRRKCKALASRLPLEEAAQEFQDYNRRYPNMIRTLGRMIGVEVDTSTEGLRELAGIMPVIELQVK